MNTEHPACHSNNDDNGAGTSGRYSRGVLSLTNIVLVLLVFLALYLPFIDKAFQIDDYAFIHLSHRIGWNPLIALPENWGNDGKILSGFLPYEITHPLLVSYIIKIFIAIFGEHEISLHLAFMIFPLISIFSLIKLNEILFPASRHIVVLLALFFCSIPAFLVNAQNLMADVPTLALIFLALAGFMYGMERESPKMIYMGGCALTLAVFCSYHAGFFIPLILLYALLIRRFDRHMAISLALPVVALLIWLMAVYYLYGLFPLIKSKSGEARSITDFVEGGLRINALINKIVSMVSFIGAAMIWVLPLHYALKKAFTRFLLLLVPATAACHAATFRLTGYEFSRSLFFSLFVALGLLTFATVVQVVWSRVKEGRAYQRELFLLLWFLIVIGYLILFFPFSSARYLLPAFPPVLMLLMNDPAWSFTTKARRIAIACVLCASLLFALASVFSDYTYADTYRNYSAQVKEFRAINGNNFNVWYVGEWGMRYYMDRGGAKYLYSNLNEPLKGDYVVIPEMPRLWVPSPDVQKRMVLFAEKSYSSRLPLRLFNRKSQAGFYCNAWGMLPFAFSYEPDEVFTVYKVVN